MKRMMVSVCCVCALGVAGLSAQADKMKKMDKPMDKDMKSATVTGCLVEKDGHYMLDNAMMSGDASAMSYELRGGDVKAHVGHKVEVTGVPDAQAGKMGKMGEKGKMGKDTMAKDKMAHDKMMDTDKAMSDTHHTLDVKSVRMVAAGCS